MKIDKGIVSTIMVAIVMICMIIFFALKSYKSELNTTSDNLNPKLSKLFNEDSLKKERIKKDSIEADHNRKLDDVTLISLDKESKCNLTKGMYVLKKIITDSSDLAFIVDDLAISLFRSSQKDENCPWPVMSAAYLYMNEKGFMNDEVIAGCSISPPDYEAYVFVNTWQVSNYKHKKRVK